MYFLSPSKYGVKSIFLEPEKSQWKSYEDKLDLKDNFPRELVNILDSTNNISSEFGRIDTAYSLETLLAGRKIMILLMILVFYQN